MMKVVKMVAIALLLAFSLGMLMNAALWAVARRLEKQGEHARQTADHAELTAVLIHRIEASVRRLEGNMEAQRGELKALSIRFEAFADGTGFT